MIHYDFVMLVMCLVMLLNKEREIAPEQGAVTKPSLMRVLEEGPMCLAATTTRRKRAKE